MVSMTCRSLSEAKQVEARSTSTPVDEDLHFAAEAMILWGLVFPRWREQQQLSIAVNSADLALFAEAWKASIEAREEAPRVREQATSVVNQTHAEAQAVREQATSVVSKAPAEAQ